MDLNLKKSEKSNLVAQNVTNSTGVKSVFNDISIWFDRSDGFEFFGFKIWVINFTSRQDNCRMKSEWNGGLWGTQIQVVENPEYGTIWCWFGYGYYGICSSRSPACLKTPYNNISLNHIVRFVFFSNSYGWNLELSSPSPRGTASGFPLPVLCSSHIIYVFEWKCSRNSEVKSFNRFSLW